MKLLCMVLLATTPMLAAAQQSEPTAKPTPKQTAAAATNTTKSNTEVYHRGPWEQQIGYSQAIRVGNTVYISGTVGADEKGFPPDLEAQMKLAYKAIKETLAHFGADFSNVVNERIQTTDVEALIKAQETRKAVYGEWLPAATWIEVRRLYSTEAKLEIDLEVRLDK